MCSLPYRVRLPGIGPHSGFAAFAAGVLAHKQWQSRSEALPRCVFSRHDVVRKSEWRHLQALDNWAVLQDLQRHRLTILRLGSISVRVVRGHSSNVVGNPRGHRRGLVVSALLVRLG